MVMLTLHKRMVSAMHCCSLGSTTCRSADVQDLPSKSPFAGMRAVRRLRRSGNPNVNDHLTSNTAAAGLEGLEDVGADISGGTGQRTRRQVILGEDDDLDVSS
jgi:hypothetical protein